MAPRGLAPPPNYMGERIFLLERVGFPAPNGFLAVDSLARSTPRSVFQDGRRRNSTLPTDRREQAFENAVSPARLIQPVSLLVPVSGDSALPSRYFALSVSESFVSLGEKHLPFAVNYQPLLLSVLAASRRAEVPGSYRLGAASQQLLLRLRES